MKRGSPLQKRLSRLLDHAGEATSSDRPAAAAMLLEEVCRLQAHPYWEILQAESQRVLGRYDEAIHLFSRLTKTAECGAQGKWRLGHVFKALGRYVEAERWYRDATVANATSAEPWIMLGAFLSHQGRTIEAIEVFDRALTAREGVIEEAYFNLALCYRTLRKFSEAQTACEKALEICPDYEAVKPVLADLQQCMLLEQEFGKDNLKPSEDFHASRG